MVRKKMISFILIAELVVGMFNNITPQAIVSNSKANEENKIESTNAEDNSEEITIKDKVLETAIREGREGKNYNDKITKEDLEELESIKITGYTWNVKTVTDIQPLEYCTNLKSIKLSFTNIPDISNISSLGNLEEFTNDGVEIKGLPKSPKLKRLSLRGCNINDISCLSECKDLEELKY